MASAIHDALKNSGISAFVASNKYDSMVSGVDYKQEIEKAIRSCKVFILVYSTHANKSLDILKEVSLAEKKIIIPVRLDFSEMRPELNYDLKRLEFIDASSNPSNAIKRLAKDIHIHISQHNYLPGLSSDKILFESGKKMLSQKAYLEAKKILLQYFEIAPDDVEARYYLALSILAGKRPEDIDGKILKHLENLMLPFINSEDHGYIRALFAIVKFGYYQMNGLKEPPPYSYYLIINSSLSEEKRKELQFHINDPKNKVYEILLNI